MCKRNSYDDDPVFYCEDCLSLRVVSIDGCDYCDECGSSSIGMAVDIFEWERLYKEKYNKKF